MRAPLGVPVPSLHDAAQVRQGVRHARHHPEGERGLARINRSARYSAMPLNEYLAMANRTLFVAHIENREILNEIGVLCEMLSLDVLFVGAGYLSQSLGVPGELAPRWCARRYAGYRLHRPRRQARRCGGGPR